MFIRSTYATRLKQLRVRIKPSLRGGVVAPCSLCPAFIHSSELFLKTYSTGAITNASLPVTNGGCPIQARFWLEWDSTALDRRLSLLQQIPRSMISYTLYSQRSRSVESHSSRQKA